MNDMNLAKNKFLERKISDKKSATLFESYVVKRYGLKRKENEKDEEHGGGSSFWDAYTKNGIPVSIKVTCKNKDHEIVLASLTEQGTRVDRDFFFVLGEWEENKDLELKGFFNISKISFFFVKKEQWNSYFGKNQKGVKLYEDFLRKYREFDTKVKEKDIEWGNAISIYKKRWEEVTPNIIKPRPRKDSAKNKTGLNRVQCVIKKKDVFDNFKLVKTTTFSEKDLEAYLDYCNRKNQYDLHRKAQEEKQEKAKKTKKTKKTNKINNMTIQEIEEAKRKRNEEIDRIHLEQMRLAMMRAKNKK